MEELSRRNILVATAAGLAAAAGQARAQSFGNPDVPPQGAINGLKNPANISDPGPNNPALSSQFPGAFLPPATDVGELPLFWACGVTPQVAIEAARPPICITHKPGAMLITDRKNSDLAAL